MVVSKLDSAKQEPGVWNAFLIQECMECMYAFHAPSLECISDSGHKYIHTYIRTYIQILGSMVYGLGSEMQLQSGFRPQKYSPTSKQIDLGSVSGSLGCRMNGKNRNVLRTNGTVGQ
jgi:hypothetical protein